MLRRIGQFALVLLALVPLWSCGDPGLPPNAQADPLPPPAIVRPANNPSSQTLQDGQYPLQQAQFDDGTGEYSLTLLNTPVGMPSTLRLSDVPMARLSEAQVQAGESSFLKVENGQPSLYLTEDFRIAYVHNVTEEQVNPNTGARETVIVRQESSFWTPFLGAVAGQAIGNLLFQPRYYLPPVYQPGVVLMGYGGYGNTYREAVTVYRDRYREAPAVERNRTSFRSTGRLRRVGSTSPTLTSPRTSSQPTLKPRPQSASQQTRPSGSGFGSSTLRRPSASGSSKVRPSSSRSRSFGSGGRSRSGGRRR